MTDATLAARYGVSPEAVAHLRQALSAGGGRRAQFDHPDLGGLGQWSSGGMVMIGRMGSHDLKGRVADLCAALAAIPAPPRSAAEPSPDGGAWWPEDLGRPAATGYQNGMAYACFPERGRVVVEREGRVTLYDTGGRAITGVAQAQGETYGLRFTGPRGTVSLDALTPAEVDADRPDDADSVAPGHSSDPLALPERLGALRAKGLLTREESAREKAKLLARF